MTPSSSRRILITGGAGFIGSHLCDALVARGDTVECVDNLSSGAIENLGDLWRHPRFHFTKADVTRSIPCTGPWHAVLHFASPASPRDYAKRPLATLQAGSEGTRRALVLASKWDARFLLASTSEVYGSPTVNPQPEAYWGNVNPIGPRSVYDEAKRFGEALTMAWHRDRGTSTGIVRIFNTYGPRLRRGDGRVVSTFIVQALADAPLTVFGSGLQTRSLCYVSDLVKGILAMLDSGEAGPINLGNPDEISVLALAQGVIRATNSNSTIAFEPLPVDDPPQRCPDIRTAQHLLAWSPVVHLADGLAATVAALRVMADQSE